MDQGLEREMDRLRLILKQKSKYNPENVYQPTYKQIEAAKLKIRKDKGEVFVDLD